MSQPFVYEDKPRDGNYKAEIDTSRDYAVVTRERFFASGAGHHIDWLYQCNVVNCGQRLRKYRAVLDHRDTYHSNVDSEIPTLVEPLRDSEMDGLDEVYVQWSN